MSISGRVRAVKEHGYGASIAGVVAGRATSGLSPSNHGFFFENMDMFSCLIGLKISVLSIGTRSGGHTTAMAIGLMTTVIVVDRRS